MRCVEKDRIYDVWVVTEGNIHEPTTWPQWVPFETAQLGSFEEAGGLRRKTKLLQLGRRDVGSDITVWPGWYLLRNTFDGSLKALPNLDAFITFGPNREKIFQESDLIGKESTRFPQ